MYKIETHDSSPEFFKMWQAAGQHLNNQVDGGIKSWFKAEPTPPWLEHLSFRLGNQLFFVRVTDVDGTVELPGNDDGHKIAARKSGGRACLMPMKKSFIGGEWMPAFDRWGLRDTFTGVEFNPIEFITDANIEISDWELNDIAIQVVRTLIEQDDYRLMSWASNPDLDPAIWFVGASGGPEWVVIRAVRYPMKSARQPENLTDIAAHASSLSKTGHFASVMVASADDQFDPLAVENGNFSPIYRGHAVMISYVGLVPITS